MYIVVDYKMLLVYSAFPMLKRAPMCFIQPWFGVIMGKTQAPETHKHMNQQELARQVIIKQPSATCKYPLQF